MTNNKKILFALLIISSILIILFLIMDFLALHDIRKDYLSKFIITYLNLELLSNLPDWTETNSEWMIVQISFFCKSTLTILNMILIIKLYNLIKK